MSTDMDMWSEKSRKVRKICMTIINLWLSGEKNVLSLSLPEREIGVKLTYGHVGDAPLSIPAFKFVIKPLPLLMLCTYSQFPGIPGNYSGSERLKPILVKTPLSF